MNHNHIVLSVKICFLVTFPKIQLALQLRPNKGQDCIVVLYAISAILQLLFKTWTVLCSVRESASSSFQSRVYGMTGTKHTVESEAIGEVQKEGCSIQGRD